MSIKKYEVFLQTADLGSFTRASEVLGYTQSAISHIITSLEEELGLKLLTRDRFGVHLTAEGAALLPAIRDVCGQNGEVVRQAAAFHGLEVGTVRIGTFLSVSVHLLPDLLDSFARQHPNVTFELLQGSYEDIERWLGEGRIDLGFLRLPTSERFTSTLLLEERILAIFPRDQAPAGALGGASPGAVHPPAGSPGRGGPTTPPISSGSPRACSTRAISPSMWPSSPSPRRTSAATAPTA